MATRAELSELLRLLGELRAEHFPDLSNELVQAIAEVESRNLESRRVAMMAVRRLVEVEVARHQ